ncbi:MAG: DUF3782 domain-containing protein [Magnetococcales bacterium]|nr:DUF3782 domain-containing protein [Magnetococcales bacterium]
MSDTLTHITAEDVWRAFLETDRRMRETDRKMQETDRKMQETDRLLREMVAENNRFARESEARMVQKIREVSTLVGNLGGRLGQFVEEMVRPACLAMFQERGLPVHEVFSRVSTTLHDQAIEIDLLVADTVVAIPVEVKSRLTPEDVQRHLDRLDHFKAFFPRFADCRIHGAVAGMVIHAEADRFAIHQGLFVIVPSGETVRLANPQDFTPRSW